MESAYGVSSSTMVCVRLFGPLEVSRRLADGSWQVVKKEAWTLGTPPRSALKRLLTTPGRRLSRGDIEDDLWPDAGVELAGQHLSNALMVIRRIVGKELVETAGSLCAIAGQERVWTDLDACKMLLRETENRGYTASQVLPLLEEALRYVERGECLEDESGTWCHAVRADAERIGRQCRMWLASGYELAGKLWQAGEVYRAMMRILPPDEEALQSWMQMLVRCGKLRDALQCYQDNQDFFEHQGFSFSSEITVFARQLQEQTTLVLPSPVPPFQDIIDETENNAEELNPMDHLRRQINLQGARIALGLASFPALTADSLRKRLLITLKQRSSSDVETIQYLQQRVEHYWEQRQAARLGPVLVPYVVEDLQRVTTLLEGSLIPNARTAFSVIAGDLAMLLGELFFEQNLYPEAREYYRTAAIAAHEASESLLEAVIYGRRSLTWIYQNQLKAAFSCVQHGLTLAAHNEHISIWLTAIEAEIQAKMGNHADCLTSLKRAARLRDLPEQKPFYWVHFDVSLLAGYEGACFLKLSKPVEAHQALTEALMTLDVTTNRRKPRLLVDLAQAYVQQGEIEAACASLLQAIGLLHSIKSPLTHKRLVSLRQELHPWQETASVQRLDAALYQLAEMR
ncbi:MAG TPA: BTAD domain-containing putative transcriptional regulator [Ktedonobacteraceae bacterium]|nr:BTAD domain-containing putative transcriptional regulator [Ktedonobacteraceae bacterium]